MKIVKNVKNKDGILVLKRRRCLKVKNQYCRVIGQQLKSILAQSLLYAYDVVSIQHSGHKLQDALVEWKEQLGRKGLKLNIKKSVVMHVVRKGKQSPRIWANEHLAQVKEYEYLHSIIIEVTIDQEISNCVRKSNSIYYTLSNKIAGKREAGKKTKLKIAKCVYLLTLTYEVESWTILDSHTSR